MIIKDFLQTHWLNALAEHWVNGFAKNPYYYKFIHLFICLFVYMVFKIEFYC